MQYDIIMSLSPRRLCKWRGLYVLILQPQSYSNSEWMPFGSILCMQKRSERCACVKHQEAISETCLKIYAYRIHVDISCQRMSLAELIA